MLIKEFISESNKNRMMTILFKYYKVENTKMKYKTMKDHAHYEVEDGVLLLSKRYKTLKPSQVKNFLITMIHEIRHAMDARNMAGNDLKRCGSLKLIRLHKDIIKVSPTLMMITHMN